MFRDIFTKRHTFLPVVHVLDEHQSIEQVLIAKENGADGVFLIGHGMSHDDLLLIHEKSKEKAPGFWIGVNCLDLPATEVFSQLTSLVDGVWVDNAEIHERDSEQANAKVISKARSDSGYRGVYFGGVAFKYQRHVSDLSRGAFLAKGYVDVVTTSGVGTGQKPPINKIQVMKEAIGDHPLAIASGITVANVKEYLPYADVFMVATGISKSFHKFDPAQVKHLSEALNG